jgi:hypothetical protein
LSHGVDILGLPKPLPFTSGIASNYPHLAGTFKTSDDPMTRWLSAVSDKTPLPNINLPGTHDSAACERTFNPSSFCRILTCRTGNVTGIVGEWSTTQV